MMKSAASSMRWYMVERYKKGRRRESAVKRLFKLDYVPLLF
jgi:hypothetical protein